MSNARSFSRILISRLWTSDSVFSYCCLFLFSHAPEPPILRISLFDSFNADLSLTSSIINIVFAASFQDLGFARFPDLDHHSLFRLSSFRLSSAHSTSSISPSSALSSPRQPSKIKKQATRKPRQETLKRQRHKQTTNNIVLDRRLLLLNSYKNGSFIARWIRLF